MENSFDDVMSKKSNEELIEIVTIDRSKYQESAIISAEREIEKRDIDNTIISDINERIEFNKSEELKFKDAYKVDNQEIISLNKFIFLSIISFGAYEIWWMYKAWKFFKQKENLDIIPGARAIFCIFFLYTLLIKILEFAKEKGCTNSYSSSTLFVCFFIGNLLSKLPDPFWLISVFSFVFIIPPFEALNFAKQNSKNIIVKEQSEFSGRQFVLIILGTIFWGLIIFGMTAS